VTRFEKGDVVHVDGASAILGDVIAVEDEIAGDGQHVTVAWRAVSTTESNDDLVLDERPENPPTLRDATVAELEAEPDVVLRAMADGAMPCTPASRRLAQEELAHREARARR
jgi:hypothetical protein